jgi:biotin carboxylase
MAHVVVLGLDEENHAILRRLPGGHTYHGLLEASDVIGVEGLDLAALLEECERRIAELPAPPDAIVGYWDFPVSSLVPLLCARRGLPAASLEAAAKCEHKYWSRLEQAKVIEDHPGFGVIDLEQPPERDELPEGVTFPVWVKPVKSASSELAFHVHDEEELAEALAEMREGIDKMGGPFEYVLDLLDVPEEVAGVGGTAALVEEEARGHQVTVEGYEYAGEVHVHGIVDSPTYPGVSSFARYQIPSRLPEEVQQRMVEDTVAVIQQIGLTTSTFNIEYFWDEETGRIRLLEINPRHSQSHAWMFEHVDGVANHQAMVRLGLGDAPALPSGEGPYETAAKCFVRHFEDGVVTRAPSREDIERIEREVEGVHLDVVVGEGDRLADLSQQDSYSYELARVYVAARDAEELDRTYDRVVELLDFGIETV